jgi:hypothetical protein
VRCEDTLLTLSGELFRVGQYTNRNTSVWLLVNRENGENKLPISISPNPQRVCL